MRRILITLLGLASLHLFVSCNKNDGETSDLVYIWFELSGTVRDAAGAPLEGITVMAESAEPVKTDTKGQFTVNGGGAPAETAAIRFVDADNEGKQYLSKTVVVDLVKYKDGHGWNKGYYRNRSEVVVTMTEETAITPQASGSW